MGRNKRGALYAAHVVPGLEGVAGDEMGARLSVEVQRILKQFDERTSILLFTTSAGPEELLQLRTTEDVFAVALDLPSVPAGRPALGAIRRAVDRAGGMEGAVALGLRVRPRKKGKPTFRVVARKAGQHAFRRVDLQRAVELGVMDRFPGWHLVEEAAQIELWATLIRDELLVAVRLSGNEMRQRTWRRASRPAALKPTVARAMVLLSRPREDDVFLDPMCGSGTILIERAEADRYRMLVGGDSDPEAVRAARENIGPRYKPIRIERWDARSLPLEDAGVSAIVSNLPFGKQIGTPAENRALYPALIAEWRRVLAPGGRMVLLTGEWGLLRRALSREASLAVTRQIPVLVRGQKATIAVVDAGVLPPR